MDVESVDYGQLKCSNGHRRTGGAENARLKEQVAELTAKVNWFMEQFKLAKRRQFGSSSERTVSTKEQPSLFNEAEKEAEPELERAHR